MFLRHNSDMPGGQIVGLGTYLPDEIVTSEELEARIRAEGLSVTEGFIERVRVFGRAMWRRRPRTRLI